MEYQLFRSAYREFPVVRVRRDHAESRLEAKINLLEADLVRLDEWPTLRNFIEELHIGGQIKGTGSIKAYLDKTSTSGFGVDVTVNASLRNGQFQGLHLKDIDTVTLEYNSNQGFLVHNLHTALKSAQDDSLRASLFLERASYHWINREMTIDDLHFQIPVEHLGWLAENLLKDVYSKGKMSKFYLPNNSLPSYIDFDGNLHMQVRMKQYNLIFKLAELFTVTVQGTVKKPTYTLQKIL